MSKVMLKVEIDEDYLKSIKASTNKTSSDIILINATPLTESDDAVSRQAVMELLNKRYCHKEPYERKEGNTVYKGYDTYYMINFDKLKALPSVIPTRAHGRWIDCAERDVWFRCSECRERVYGGHHNFCPNCGAEMR